MKAYQDSRLPNDIEIFNNNWNEFVAVYKDSNTIAKFNGACISGSKTLEGAINKFLNKITNQPSYLEL